MSIRENRFDDRATLVDALVRGFTADLERSIERNDSATLLLSGGSTPAPLYRKLSDSKLDWKRIHVALVDERWVDTAHEASNERLLRENLLIGDAAAATFVGMKNNAANPFDGVTECNARYAELPRPYTICLLGMGPDGHTASLFPRARGLDAAMESKQHCAPIRARQSDVTGEHLERMTLTPHDILGSQRLLLLITGADKWTIYQRAREPGAAPELPISHFIHQQKVPLEVYWAP